MPDCASDVRRLRSADDVRHWPSRSPRALSGSWLEVQSNRDPAGLPRSQDLLRLLQGRGIPGNIVTERFDPLAEGRCARSVRILCSEMSDMHGEGSQFFEQAIARLANLDTPRSDLVE